MQEKQEARLENRKSISEFYVQRSNSFDGIRFWDKESTITATILQGRGVQAGSSVSILNTPASFSQPTVVFPLVITRKGTGIPWL